MPMSSNEIFWFFKEAQSISSYAFISLYTHITAIIIFLINPLF